MKKEKCLFGEALIAFFLAIRIQYGIIYKQESRLFMQALSWRTCRARGNKGYGIQEKM